MEGWRRGCGGLCQMSALTRDPFCSTPSSLVEFLYEPAASCLSQPGAHSGSGRAWLACGRAELLGSSDPENRSFFFFSFLLNIHLPPCLFKWDDSWVMVHVILPSAQGTEAQVPTAVTCSLHTVQWPSFLLLSLPIPSVLPGTTSQINQLHLSPYSEPSWKGIQTKATQITALNVFFCGNISTAPILWWLTPAYWVPSRLLSLVLGLM